MNIKQIADLAGVSVATVSRVLNDSPRVSKKTREKVLKIMEEHHYVPSSIARNLSLKKSTYVAVIVPDITNAFFSEVIQGLSKILYEKGYNLLLMNTDEDVAIQHTHLQTVLEQQVAGLFITPVIYNDSQTKKLLLMLQGKKVPIIFIDRDIDDFNTDGIYIDNYMGAFEATEHMIEKGYKEIGIITGPEDNKPAISRYQGYLDALEKYDLKVNFDYVTTGDFKMAGGYEGMRYLVEKTATPPEAVVVSNNKMTLGAFKYLSDNNLTLKEDIDIIAFDQIDFIEWFNIPISYVKGPTFEMGELGAKILLKKIAGPLHNTTENIVLSTELIVNG